MHSVFSRRKSTAARKQRSFRKSFHSNLEQLESREMLTVQPFTGGDVVALVIGDGTYTLKNGGNPIKLMEFNPTTGNLVQSIDVPSTGANPLISSGTAQTNSELSLSADGQHLSFLGYRFAFDPLYNVSIKGSGSNPGVNRGLGFVDVLGNVDTTTSLSRNFSFQQTGNDAVTLDNTHFYMSSNGASIGLRLGTLGTNAAETDPDPTTLVGNTTTVSKFNDLQFYDNGVTKDLYAVSATGNKVYRVDNYTGTPTFTQMTGVTFNLTTGFADMFLATLNPSAHSAHPGQPDTLYITSPVDAKILKYTAATYDVTSGAPLTWTAAGSVTMPGGTANPFAHINALSGWVNGSSITLFASSGATDEVQGTGGNGGVGGGSLFSVTDTSGAGSMNGTPNTLIASTAADPQIGQYYNIHGLSIVPNQAPTLTSGNVNLTDVLQTNTNPTGSLVSSLITSLGVGAISDTGDTTGALQKRGIAITTAGTTGGNWQYSTNGGSSWTNVPALTSDSNFTQVFALAADASTKVRFLPSGSYSGTSQIAFRAWDQSTGSNGSVFSIRSAGTVTGLGGATAFSTATATATQNVLFVNHAPTFTRGLSQTVLDTAVVQTVANWATNISAGTASESSQLLNFIVGNNNNSLFAVQPSISASGTLTYTPAPGANGIATVTVQLHDDGGTANGGSDTSVAKSFTISVTPAGVDMPPVVAIPFDALSTLENQNLTITGGNAISMSDTDANSGDTVQVSLSVTNGTVALSTLIGLSGTGNGTSTLTYTGTKAALNAALAGLVYSPTHNVNGIGAGLIAVTANDLGHNGTGGPKTATETVTIDITAVNQVPIFTIGNDVIVAQNSPAQTVPNQATGISAGAANESTQTLNFIVTNSNNTLFSVQPSISPTGTLTFTPATNQTGTAIVSVQLHDNGGTLNGGVDTSAVQTFLISVSTVDQAPTITLPGTQRLIKNELLPIGSATFNAITIADVDGFGSTEQITLTATHGTITLAAGSGVNITSGTGANDITVTFQGNLTQLNAAVNGMVYTPAVNYTGAASIAIAVNDLSPVAPGPLTTSATLNINLIEKPSIVINELLFDPPGVDHPDSYIEIRSSVPNYTFPAHTYLAGISAISQTTLINGNTATFPGGSVYDLFDLSGVSTGANGYLVILENGNTYNNYPLYGGQSLIDPQSAVLDNGINPDGSIAIGTGSGFGNNYLSPGSSIVGHSSLPRTTDIDLIEKFDVSYVLVSSTQTVNLGDNADPPTSPGGSPTGTLHGPVVDGKWTVYDSVGFVGLNSIIPGEVGYGYLNHLIPGGTGYGTPGSTVVTSPNQPTYFARSGDTWGSLASDWVISSGNSGIAPYLETDNNHVQPSTFDNRPQNNIGGPNFDASQPAVLAIDSGSLDYHIGDGNVTVSPTASATDPDSWFFAKAKVTISGNFNPATDSLAFAGSTNITATFDSGTGELTLKGDAPKDEWNAALSSVTFNYSGSVVSNPATRTVTFALDDGLVLSNHPTRTINILGTVVNPPIVGGTSSSALTWTEVVPQPLVLPTVTVAPNLTVSDVSTSNITGATVSISAGFTSHQDTLGYDSVYAMANGLTVDATNASRLTITGTATLAVYQQFLRSVTYSNSSQAPATATRTVTFTVVDDNSITSSVTTNSQQAVSVVAVNNPPTVTTSSGTDSYTAGNPAFVIDPGLTATDPDTTNLTGATIHITSGFVAGDVLGFVNQLGITGSYNASTGTLTLTGSTIPSDYQAALRAVTFSTGSGTTGGNRTVSFTATGGSATSSAATKVVSVTSNISFTQDVTTTADSGTGSLRQALLNVNLGPAGTYTIHFALSSGSQLISPATALPGVTKSIIVSMDNTQHPQVGSGSTGFSWDNYTSFTMTGNGSLAIGGNQSAHPAGSTMTVQGGTLDFLSNAGNNVSLAVGNATGTPKILFDASQTLAGLSILANGAAGVVANGATGVLAAQPALVSSAGDPTGYVPGNKYVIANNVTVAAGGHFDVNDGILVVNNGNQTTLKSLLQSGGLISSTVQYDANNLLGLTGLGMGDNFDLSYTGIGANNQLTITGSLIPAASDFGQQFIFKYTYIGDANLDGKVTTSDYDFVFGNLGSTTNGVTGNPVIWGDGDFNGNGVVDTTDLDNLFANLGFGTTGNVQPPLRPSTSSSGATDVALASTDSSSLVDDALVGILASPSKKNSL